MSGFTKILELSTLIVLILSESRGSDDYDQVYERRVRSESPQMLLDGGLYSIESVTNHLYLTAKSGIVSPGPVNLKEYSESGSQLWLTIKYDTSRGYNLKPLSNEFNEVTSTLENNAHAYNAWEFKPIKPNNQVKNHFIIFNALNKRCLQSGKLKEPVHFAKCNPGDSRQHWKLHRIE